jgi:hypothetical protein
MIHKVVSFLQENDRQLPDCTSHKIFSLAKAKTGHYLIQNRPLMVKLGQHRQPSPPRGSANLGSRARDRRQQS